MTIVERGCLRSAGHVPLQTSERNWWGQLLNDKPVVVTASATLPPTKPTTPSEGLQAAGTNSPWLRCTF